MPACLPGCPAGWLAVLAGLLLSSAPRPAPASAITAHAAKPNYSVENSNHGLDVGWNVE